MNSESLIATLHPAEPIVTSGDTAEHVRKARKLPGPSQFSLEVARPHRQRQHLGCTHKTAVSAIRSDDLNQKPHIGPRTDPYIRLVCGQKGGPYISLLSSPKRDPYIRYKPCLQSTVWFLIHTIINTCVVQYMLVDGVENPMFS